MIDAHATGAMRLPQTPGTGFEAVLFTRTPAPSSAPQRSGRGLARWQVRRVSEHVRANLDKTISLAELAALVRLSRHHFCTAFRLATGITPGEWVTETRLRRAAELLEEQTLSITEIALEVGYETPSSFSARFRQVMGVTPSEYRRDA